MRLVSDIGRQAPGERKHRHALREGDVEGGAVQEADYVVDAEGSRGELADTPDFVPELVSRHAAARDDAQTAGVADGSHQLGRGASRHPGLEDGALDAEETADRRAQAGHRVNPIHGAATRLFARASLSMRPRRTWRK